MKGIPQTITLILYTMVMGMQVNDCVQKNKSASTPIINYLLLMGLLWWGGFFT